MTTISVDKPKQALPKSTVVVVSQAASNNGNRLLDLLDLVKPRISSMVLVTVALAAFVASGGHPDLFLVIHALIGTALVAASSGAFNQWLEQHIDAKMDRTSGRPLPAGRMSEAEVIAFGLATLTAGSAYLAITVGWPPMGWALATWLVYVCVYTPMKTWTHWNTFVGAVSGALPILIGWSAVGGSASWSILAMLCVLFLWQFPHFIAIAWIYRRQYADAGLQMVTTTDPSGRTAGIYSVSGALLLVLSSLLPLFHDTSVPYALAAVSLGVYQLWAAWNFHSALDDRSARHLLKASIIYLPLALGLIAVHAAF